MGRLSIDIETYSDVDIGKAGLFRYAQSPAFQILLVAWSVDDGPVALCDLTEEPFLPRELLRGLFDPAVTKHAYNAAFEWYCLSRYFRLEENRDYGPGTWLPQWRDTMAHAMYCGFPAGLAAAGSAMGLPEDRQKLATGKALIRYFCNPCSPTKTNGGRTRNLPRHDPDKWALFRDYCRQDVVTEMAIEERLGRFPMPEAVQRQWVTDQIIALRGVAADLELVEAAQELDAAARSQTISEAVTLSGLQNPNSVGQLVAWLERETGGDVPDLTKATVKELLGGKLKSERARRMLEIRQELGKTSNKKYAALQTAACDDGRVRGLLQFYGANRTGRWAGRIVQPQNLPRTYIDGELLPLARELVKERRAPELGLIFGSVPETLSQLIRTALVAAPGKRLVDADFSAIEARVLAWLAGEEWVLDVFRTHGKIYEATAATLYGVPMEKIQKGREEYRLRQYGKAATLALGYAGGASALITAGGLPKDTPEELLCDIRDRWRRANPMICQFWRTVEAAARAAVQDGRASELPLPYGGSIAFARETDPQHELDFMTLRLPGGRKLYYVRPFMGVNRFGQPSVCYWGKNQQSGKWGVTETFGGKLVENLTQAVARDCLAEAVERLEAAGLPVVFHIHDEVVVEKTPAPDDLDRVTAILRVPPDWATGLPLDADGWTNAFFKKD